MISNEQKNKNILARTDTKQVDGFNAYRITLIDGKSFSVLDSSGKSKEEFYMSAKSKFGNRLKSVA